MIVGGKAYLPIVGKAVAQSGRPSDDRRHEAIPGVLSQERNPAYFRRSGGLPACRVVRLPSRTGRKETNQAAKMPPATAGKDAYRYVRIHRQARPLVGRNRLVVYRGSVRSATGARVSCGVVPSVIWKLPSNLIALDAAPIITVNRPGSTVHCRLRS